MRAGREGVGRRCLKELIQALESSAPDESGTRQTYMKANTHMNRLCDDKPHERVLWLP